MISEARGFSAPPRRRQRGEPSPVLNNERIDANWGPQLKIPENSSPGQYAGSKSPVTPRLRCCGAAGSPQSLRLTALI